MKGTIKKLQKGFTLVELVTVIAIVGVLTAIIVPSMMNYIRKAQRRVDTANARQIWEMVTAIVTEAEVGDLPGSIDVYGGHTYDPYTAFYNTNGSARFFGGVQVYHNGSASPETYDLMVVAKMSGCKGSNRASRNRYRWSPGQRENTTFTDEFNARLIDAGDGFVGDSGTYKWAMKYISHTNDDNADQWLICWRKQDKRIEIWAGDSTGTGNSGPLFRVWPDPCDEYSNSYYDSPYQHANTVFAWTR